MSLSRVRRNCVVILGWIALLFMTAHAADVQVRADHPRLFFNADSLPAVKARAKGTQAEEFKRIRAEVDVALAADRAGRFEAGRDHGFLAAQAAFVFLVTDDPGYRDLAQKCLRGSVAFYEDCYEKRRSVDWKADSRVHFIMGWDWLYNTLPEAERRDLMGRFLRVVDKVVKARPGIDRENLSHYRAGMYGLFALFWPGALAVHGTGIEPEIAAEWMERGRIENEKMIDHRGHYAGDDGGGATSTLLYSIGAYPYADWNYYYVTLSATGEDIEERLWHNALMANYLLWNYLPHADGQPRHMGYGDSHQRNKLRIQPITHRHVFTHTSLVKNIYGPLFGTRYPEETLQAIEHIQALLPPEERKWSEICFIYPFLGDGGRHPGQLAPLAVERLPRARHFERMGQVYLASGFGPRDTYMLFSCGGTLNPHQHYDALHFTLYAGGEHLAIDSGERARAESDSSHLVNYYSQTVAHNTILVNQPGEPGATHWGKRGVMDGGQHRRGSSVKAFETNEHFSYVAGDATESYRHGSDKLPEKVEEVTRQIVFLPPSHFVIFDRVTATQADFAKRWLLHTIREPKVFGNRFHADQGEQRLHVQSLLPKNSRLNVIGGPGQEYVAAGKNWPLPGAEKYAPDEMEMGGSWRVEVAPASAGRTDFFLHVLEVSDTGLATPAQGKLLESADGYGVEIKIGDNTWTVTFNKAGELGGGIAARGALKLNQPLSQQVQPQSGVYASPTLRYDEGVRRLPERQLPGFWMAAPAEIEKFLSTVRLGKVEALARSAGNRDTYVVRYGEKEGSSHSVNFNSAVGGHDPELFGEKRLRKKPVVLILGPVHGQEPEGAVGLANLINVMETGRDLRGREHAELRALAQQCRLVVVPYGNPDGLARFTPRTLQGMTAQDMSFWGQGTWADHSIRTWPVVKRQHPMKPENCGFLGCYYDDAGTNLMHDDFFNPRSRETPAILALVRDEAPDLATSLHSAGGGPAIVCGAWMPEDKRASIERLAKLYDDRVLTPFKVTKPTFRPGFEKGTPSFNLTSAMYHAGGGAAFTFETPSGLVLPNFPHYTLDDLLDIQLALYETMFRFALAEKAGK